MGKASRKKRSSETGSHVDGQTENPAGVRAHISSRSYAHVLIPSLLIALVSFAVFYNALPGDFVFDDEHQIIDNPWIRDFSNIPTIFSKSVWSFRTGLNTSNYYRPLMHIVYMLNYHIFGLNPWGFHLVNVLFHCGVSVLVFLIIRRLFAEQRTSDSPAYLSPSFMAALLFAAHPIHTEAVTWIAGLPDTAFTFFYLLSFYYYMLFRESSKISYLFSIISFSAAVLFKEPAITLPIMLFCYDYRLKQVDKKMLAGIKRYVPYLAIIGVYFLARYYALRSFAPISSYPDLSTYQLIINILPLFRKYLTSLLWPYDLNLWHTFHPIRSLFGADGIISVVVSVIFFIFAVLAYRNNRLIFFGLLLFLIPLLPVFYIKGISGNPFAERYLYLPSAGYVLLLAVLLSWARKKLPGTTNGFLILFILIAGLYTVGTINRNKVWQDSFVLWSDTVKKSPDSSDAHYNLGIAYSKKGLWKSAMAEFETVLRLKPDYAEAHTNLGVTYFNQGLRGKAIEEYQTALRLKPDYAEGHYNLGVAYSEKGLWDKAIAEYQKAVQLKPDYIKAYNNLGNACGNQGLLDRAIEEYQTALQLKPDFEDAHYNLGVAYSKKGQMERAKTEYQKALQLKPDFRLARLRLNEIESGRH